MKPYNLWLKKSCCRPDNEETIQSDLDTFLSEVKRSGVLPEGTLLRNSEVCHATYNNQDTDSRICKPYIPTVFLIQILFSRALAGMTYTWCTPGFTSPKTCWISRPGSGRKYIEDQKTSQHLHHLSCMDHWIGTGTRMSYFKTQESSFKAPTVF